VGPGPVNIAGLKCSFHKTGLSLIQGKPY
jgi:hypothetical protein